MTSTAPLLFCRGTHSDYDRQGYSFRLAKQIVEGATITEVITLPVGHDWGRCLLPVIPLVLT